MHFSPNTIMRQKRVALKEFCSYMVVYLELKINKFVNVEVDELLKQLLEKHNKYLYAMRQ